MRYQDVLRLGNISYFPNHGGAIRAARMPALCQEKVNIATSDLRAVALLSDYEPPEQRPVAVACKRAKVKRRVLKRWSIRLIREGLPRSARMTGGQLATFRARP